MDQIQTLARQTKEAYQWTNKLLDGIPIEKWEETPEVLQTNVAWQVGHLILSFYYHSVSTIVGHQPDILTQIPLKEYAPLYAYQTPPNEVIGKASTKKLYEQLMLVEKKSLDVIQSLSIADLDQPLEPANVPHPIAINKWEALDWNVKHTMWHCGQLGILKRVVDKGYDFGLKKS